MRDLFLKYVLRNMAGMAGISVYILADTFFISLCAGADGITVLNLTLPLYGLLFAIGSMIGIGSATRYTLDRVRGHGNYETYFSHAIFWQLLFALPFVLLGIFRPKAWLYLMGADPQIAELGSHYVRIIQIGAPLFMINYSFTAFARNDNAPTTAMVAAVGASVFNIVFDYIFMFPLHMGLSGTALATTMAPGLSCLICCTHYFGPHARVHFRKTGLSLKLFTDSCRLGVSAFVGEISAAISTVVFNILLLRSVGNIGVAAYGITANLAAVATALFGGIAQGMQPLVSTAFGKGRKKDVAELLRLGILSAGFVEALLLILTFGFTEGFVAAFNSEGSAALAEYAGTALRLYFLGYIPAGVNIVLIAYYSAIGQTQEAAIASLLRGAAASIGCAVVMAYLFGLNGIWLSFAAAEGLTFLVILLMMLGRRRHFGYTGVGDSFNKEQEG